MKSHSLTFNSGGHLLTCLNKISLDGLYSIAFYNNHISIYSLQSRLSVKTFHLHDLNFETSFVFTDIVDTYLSKEDPNLIQLLTKNGYILTLNWFENLKAPIVNKRKVNSDAFELTRILSCTEEETTLLIKTDKKKYGVFKYKFSSNELYELEIFENVNSFAISSNLKNLLFVINNKNFVVFQLYEDTFESFTVDHTSSSSVNNVAISNNFENPLLAFTNSTSLGNITLLFDIKSDDPPFKNLKWHIEPPSTLEFNSDQTYLLTGGDEKVLVFWNILNEKQQFLPRLNGVIKSIKNSFTHSNLIELELNIIDQDSQYIIINSIDLLSKLDLNCPHLFNGAKSVINKALTKDANSFKKSGSTKYTKFNNLSNDIKFEIDPESNSLYFKNGKYLQIFDYLNNKQISNLSITNNNLNYGKIGNEKNIKDNKILNFKFIKSNKNFWLITLDFEFTNQGENIDSTSGFETLKFWKFSNDKWTLQSKIIKPHDSFNIIDICVAPVSYFGGEAIATLDNKGNVKLWRPNTQGTWSLRKFYLTNNDNLSDLNSLLSWSLDNSIISISKNSKIELLDINSFDIIQTIKPNILSSRFHSNSNTTNNINERFIELNLQDKSIQFMKFSKNGNLLIIQTRSYLTVVDILKNECIFGLLLSGGDLSGFGNSIVNLRHGEEEGEPDELLIVSKYFNKNGEVNSKLSLWDINDSTNEIECKLIDYYENIILGSSFNSSWNKWILVDIDSNIGELSLNDKIVKENIEGEKENWIVSHLLNNARILNKVKKNNLKNEADEGEVTDMNDRVGLSGTAFDDILQNIDGVSVSVLFERVLSVI